MACPNLVTKCSIVFLVIFFTSALTQANTLLFHDPPPKITVSNQASLPIFSNFNFKTAQNTKNVMSRRESHQTHIKTLSFLLIPQMLRTPLRTLSKKVTRKKIFRPPYLHRFILGLLLGKSLGTGSKSLAPKFYFQGISFMHLFSASNFCLHVNRKGRSLRSELFKPSISTMTSAINLGWWRGVKENHTRWY